MPGINDVLIGDDVTPMDPSPKQDPAPSPDPEPAPDPNPNPNPDPAPDPEPDDTKLAEGTRVEDPDGNLYTVDSDGNLLDKDGNIFKEAKDVKDYLSQFDNSDDVDDNFSIANLQSLVDVEVTDENGKPVEFTDDAEGRQAYINKVIELKQNEASKVAMDTFFSKNPIVKQFNDFITLGGNPQDFGKIQDRTGVEFEADNANQHKQIIRIAFAEQGRKGNVESYINWLEDSGALADTAKQELEAIKANDKARLDKMAADAKAAREQELEDTKNYITGVLNKIESGVIGGYKIPETVTVEKNGQKLNYTRRDFFNYVTRIDKKTGTSQYQNDLNNMSDSDYTDRELLDAWIHFTGGSYKTLVDMAVKTNEVAKLKLVAKKAASKSKGAIQIHKPSGSGSSIHDVVL